MLPPNPNELDTTRFTRAAAHFVDGLGAFRGRTRLVAIFGTSAAMWLADVAMYYIVGKAFGIEIGVGGYFLLEATADLPNVEIEIFTNLVVDFAKERGANVIVKGIRAISDFEYELEMNQLNRQLASDIESIYLMASPQYSFLSSSGVKEIAIFGGDVSELVPEGVARRLQEALAR